MYRFKKNKNKAQFLKQLTTIGLSKYYSNKRKYCICEGLFSAVD